MIVFKNELTGEMKQVKVGFSWVLLLLADFFGIPLFMRKLTGWGVIMLLFCLTGAVIWLFPVCIGLSVYLAVCGNKITALNYIRLGYKVAEIDPVRIELAKREWGLPDNAFITKAG